MANSESLSPAEWDIFIAHATVDAAAAEALFQALSGRCAVFLATRCVPAGVPFDLALAAAQRASRVTVVLVTTGFEQAHYAREEASVGIALSRLPGSKHRVVPVYLHGGPSVEGPTGYGLFHLQSLSLERLGSFDAVAAALLSLLGESAPEPETRAPAAEAVSRSLRDYPRGPLVESHLVPRTLVRGFAAAIPPRDAASVLDEAITLRVGADPTDSQLRYVRHHDVVPPESNPAIVYWTQVFNEARLHGPRMVAALLQAVDSETLPTEAKAAKESLLRQLRGST